MGEGTEVRGLLAAAGFAPPEEDVAILEHTYPVIRQMVALLYSVEEARDEAPAVRFRADPL
jgi:hypothetical protein